MDTGPIEAMVALADADDERGLLRAATSAIVELLGDRGSCLLTNGDTRVVVSTQSPSPIDWRVDLARYPEISTSLESGIVVAIPDAQNDPRLDAVRLLLPPHVRAVAVVPLVVRGQRLGALMVRSRSVRPMGPHAVSTAALLGRLAAHLLDGLRARRPIDERAPTLRLTGPSLPPVSTGAGRRVLIVEDDSREASAISSILEDAGYQVQRAADGERAVRSASQQAPDLIVLDNLEFERLCVEAYLDELTGLGNLRLFHERLHIEASRASRYHTQLALVMLDVDKLKAINDRAGHAAGSAALAAIGAALRAEVRESDLAARYGGDEFVVLLPHCSDDDGVQFARRVQARVREIALGDVRVTVSAGVAAADGHAPIATEALLAAADAALYRAKLEGGDRIYGTEAVGTC